MTVARWTMVLAAAFVALTDRWTWDNSALAAAIGLGVALLSARGPATGRSVRARLGATARMPRFVLAIVWHMVRGTAHLVRAFLARGRAARTRTIEVPMLDRTDEGAALSGLIITAIPGSVLEGVDEERRVMLLDELEPDDEARAREAYQSFYRRFQRPVRP